MTTQIDDLSRSLVALEQDTTLIAAVELSQSSWLVSAIVPGLERQPQKKLEPDPSALLKRLERWRDEGVKAGRTIRRIVLAFEAGRDGFWLARWLRKRGIETHVIHSTSVAVSREHRRAKTDRLDLAMLMRVFLGWLRGERKHCSMVAIPTLEQEDAKRPSRERESLTSEKTRVVNRMKSALARLGIRGFKPELRKAPQKLAALSTPEGVGLPPNTRAEIERDMARLVVVRGQIEAIERTRLERLQQAPADDPNAIVLLLARVIGVGVETADMLVQEVISRKLRDRRAVARYAGLTGAPDESGSKRREKGLAKAGNARVRRGLMQLAWRFLRFQRDSALAQWYRARTDGATGARKTTMIVALARKLLIALWRMVTTGEIPAGVALRPAA
ncbi:MAG TPA: IS110 family transposase [Caulobacteraceae bacterium]|nr:IS110 family transposase [Caulobacteraceae bacterium]